MIDELPPTPLPRQYGAGACLSVREEVTPIHTMPSTAVGSSSARTGFGERHASCIRAER
ncbi:hypothetical protein ACWDRB_56605 [Nonomuraea sp. NPDC003707]